MYNCTEERWLETTYSTLGEGKALFSRNVKLGMFGLEMEPKENFVAYSTQIVFLIIRLLLRNVLMVAINTCGKNTIMGELIYEIK